MPLSKTYRHQTQIHRSASFIHSAPRIKSVRAKWESIMRECQLFGPKRAQELNDSISLSTISRRWKLWKVEDKECIPLENRRSTYYNYSDSHWNRKLSPEQESRFVQHLKSIVDAKVEILTKRTVKA